jgi:hypothetical protein
MLPLAGNEKFRVRGRVRVRSKNENDSGGPRERKPRPRRGSFLVARNRSSIVLVLVLVSAIGCKGEDVGVPQSNKLALIGLKPWAESSSPFGFGAVKCPNCKTCLGRTIEQSSQRVLNLAPFLTDPFALPGFQTMIPAHRTAVDSSKLNRNSTSLTSLLPIITF